MLQKGAIDLQYTLVVAKYIGYIATTLAISSGHTLYPIYYITTIYIGHTYILG
jgi:hypothetical protein